LRQFPALVNCCTIDWFSEWPRDALESVALKFLQDMPDLETTDEIINGLMNICQEMHQTVAQDSIRYKEEQGRYNYVTPTSYLELLSIFSKIFGNKKNELIQAKKRTKTGLDKVSFHPNAGFFFANKLIELTCVTWFSSSCQLRKR
jgi:dynein heavy chain